MKRIKSMVLCAPACLSLAFSGCGLGLDPLANLAADPDAASVLVRMPECPDQWSSCLGACSWSLRWFGPDGAAERLDGVRSEAAIELRADAVAPILAYPYWPDLGIPAGIAKPAGAVYPFGGGYPEFGLDWLGGVSAVFFRELLYAGGPEATDPARFDWPRFRALLAGEDLGAEAREDPWRVDWRSVAVKTRASGFDRRRIVACGVDPLSVSSPAPGPWARASPFAPMLPLDPGGAVTLPASALPDAVFCLYGTLAFSRAAWAWYPWDSVDMRSIHLLAARLPFE
jgi:hypothetical protein